MLMTSGTWLMVSSRTIVKITIGVKENHVYGFIYLIEVDSIENVVSRTMEN